MASFEEGLRHFWLRDIHQVGGVTAEELRQWIIRRKFVVTHVNGRDDFIIRVLAPTEAVRAIAHDSTRMASAAFETMLGISTVKGLPRSSAWILIRAYYAAYFAAHSLLRTFGTVCIQLDAQQTSSFDRVASAFGMLPNLGFETGYYLAEYQSGLNEIHFRKTSAARRGSHEVLWEAFADKLREASNHLLTVSAAFTGVALQLANLETFLRQAGHNGGSWLSHVRNQTNYRHEYGLWFPYADSKVESQDLARIVKRWKIDPAKLFPVDSSDQITEHVSLCTIIVSICHAVAMDIETHSPAHKSFHTYGGLALTRLAKN